jgi:hypothetical protein
LNNPFENAQAVGIDYSRASPASLCSEVDEDSDDLVTDEDSSDDDEDSGYSGESSSGNDPGDVGIEIQAFLRRVRFVKDLFSYCYISCIDYVGHLAESASDSTNKLNGRCSVVLNLSYRPAVWLP